MNGYARLRSIRVSAPIHASAAIAAAAKQADHPGVQEQAEEEARLLAAGIGDRARTVDLPLEHELAVHGAGDGQED